MTDYGEPWHTVEDELEGEWGIGNRHRALDNVIELGDWNSEENIQRIVACVNYCKGIPMEALLRGPPQPEKECQ